MNRTLVKLAQAMLTAAQLPEFLWQPAIMHTAVRIPLVLRSDRPHQTAHQPLASGSHCLPFNSRHSLTASSSNSGARYRKQITPLPAFTASRLSPFTFHFLYIFLSIWCNNTRYTHSLPTLLAL